MYLTQAFCRSKRASSEQPRPPARRLAGAAGRIALVLVVLFAPAMLRVPAAQAQSDNAFGPLEDAGAVLPAARVAPGLSRLSLNSWHHDPVGTVAAWIIGMEETRPQFIPEDAVLHAIPGHSSYRYVVIAGHRLVVDAATRAVIYVVD